MTYRLKALVSTVILAPILRGSPSKIFALDFFQRFGTTLYIIEWTVSYKEMLNVNQSELSAYKEILDINQSEHIA